MLFGSCLLAAGVTESVVLMAWTRLRGLAVRFEALLADFRAGRLPAAGSVRGTAENLPQPPNLPGLPPPFRAPRDFGWLLRLAPESAAYAGQVEHLLADPEMKALLAGSPQAGRMLRPLCRMLGIEAGLELLPPRRGVRASPPGGVSLGGAAAPVAPEALLGSGSEPGADCAPRAMAPSFEACGAPNSQFPSTGSYFARQNGGPGLGSRSGPQFGSELESRSWPAGLGPSSPDFRERRS